MAKIVVFGSINVDLVCHVEEIARPGETVLSPSHEQAFGGKGANQAVAARRAGGTVAMIGAVGDDAYGKAAAANLEREGIDTGRLAVMDAPTGCAFISVDRNGENAITVSSGANALLGADDLLLDDLPDAAILVMQMEVPAHANLAMAEQAQSRGLRTLLNYAPASARIETTVLEALLRTIDVLVLNEHELGVVAGLCGCRGDDRDRSLRSIARDFDLVAVVTLGARGAAVAAPFETVETLAAPVVRVVDTTGAGDTFAGILAAGLAAGLDTMAAARRAVAGASLACTVSGAQGAMPTPSEIERMIANPV